MNNEALKEQAARFVAPVRELNEVAVDKTEKLVKLQMTALESYSRLAFDHWRAALGVRDADSLKDFLGKHRAYLETVTEKAAKDTGAVVELGNEYVAEVQKIFKDNAPKAARKAA